MASFTWPPQGSSGIPTYANFASLPATAADGAAAITLDSDSLYIFNAGSMTWILAGGTGVPLSVGTIDSQPKSTDGAVFSANQLIMQSADITDPGLVNIAAQSFAGNKTFTGGVEVPIVPANTTYTTVAAGTSTDANQLYIQGRYGYLASSAPANALQVFDLTIPTTPVLIGNFPSLSDVLEFSIVLGNLAYCILDFGVQIYDISNPALPVSLSAINIGQPVNGATVQGNFIYFACGDSTVKSYNVTDPTNIIFVDSVAANSGNAGLTSNDRYLFVWEYDTNTFEIFDITNPASLVSKSITTISGTGTNYGFVQDTHIYIVANGSGGFEAWDISDVTAPVLSSSLNIGGNPQQVFVQDNTAYVSSQTLDSVQVIDITNPSSMSIVGSISTGSGSAPLGIFVSGRYIYTANSGTGTLGIIDSIGSYIQQLEAGGIEAGSIAVRTTLSVGNDLDVKGSASFGGAVNLQSYLGVDKNIQAIGTVKASNFSGSSSGTNTGDVTLGTANGLSIAPTQILSLGLSSTSTTGSLSSTDWNTFNNKQSTLTLGNLTSTPTTNLVVTGGTGAIIGSGALLTLTGASLVEATSSVLTITGATNAVLGTGVSIQVKQAATAQNGYLSSTDWNTFNGKQAAGNYITALTGDVTASGPGSVASTLATVNSNVGAFTNANITVNAKGLITAAANGTSNSFVAPTVQEFTSSSSTYTLPTSPRMPLYLRVRIVGGGGGGGGSGITPGTASAGGPTTFGTSLLVGNGGAGGASGSGGLGGTASLGSGPLGIAVAGSQGAGSVTPGLSGNNSGGAGGATPFGGAGGGASSTNGTSAATNSGSGGGGGGAAAAVAIGGGGGAGGFVDVIITSPLSTYNYVVGGGGAGASGSTASGGNGAAGIIIVEEYYQ